MDGRITWRGFQRRGRNSPRHGRFCINEKTWVLSGLLSSGRVGLTDDKIRSTTWVAVSKGRMGSTDGNKSTTWVTLSNGRGGSTDDGIKLTALISLSERREGLTEDGIVATTFSTGSTKDVTRLTTQSTRLTDEGTRVIIP
jgi:hypothetical protein